MNNSFVKQFDQNIKFNYSCFDRVILRGYIIRLFFAGGIAVLLRALGFNSLSNGVMRILTDQLNSHIEKIAKAQNIPIHWWPSVNGGTDGAKQKYVQEKYASFLQGKRRSSLLHPYRQRTLSNLRLSGVDIKNRQEVRTPLQMPKTRQAVLHLLSRLPIGWTLLPENLFIPAISVRVLFQWP